MELTYIRKGDYLYPNLAVEPEEPVTLGKYGRLREKFLKENRNPAYQALMVEGLLNKHLMEIDQRASEMMDLITRQMAKAEGVTEKLKAEDQMQWVQRMNSIQMRAEESILTDLVYSKQI